MRVILFRHGPAAPRNSSTWPDDSVRPLTSPGALLTRAAAEGLGRIESNVAVVVSSPASRTRQTARMLANVFDTGEIEELESLGPDGSILGIVRYLSARPPVEGLILVGHEPGLGLLASALLIGAPAGLHLKRAGAMSIQFDGTPREGTGRLSWLLSPRILRQMLTSQRRGSPRSGAQLAS